MAERSLGGIGSLLPVAGRAAAGPSTAWGTDLQSVLTRAVHELGRSTGCARIAAWTRGPDGAPVVVCARLEGSSLRQPDEAAYTAAATLAEPADLGRPDLPPSLHEAAARYGLSAGVAVVAGSGEGLAALLLGDDAEPAGRVRPRTLAALGAAARAVAGPAAAARGAERLSRMDAEVRRLDRLAALGGLVAEIVHEIRNPLVSVKTFLQLLPERLHEPEFRESFLEVASDELRRVERLLEVVLRHGRPAPPARPDDLASLAATLESVLQLAGFRADERGVGLEAGDAEGLPELCIGSDALRQVVLNLVLNAIEMTPSGGAVRLAAQAREGGVELVVDDEGPGVPAAERERIFEPFYSTKSDRPGGLGLAITRRIVEEVGGRLAVGDAPVRGASFRVWLPAAAGGRASV